MHQKLLVLVWSWMMVVLISAYKGNLISMITKPTITAPFMNAEDMVGQTQVKWAVSYTYDQLATYAKDKSPNEALRKIFDNAHISYKSEWCESIAKKSKDMALACDITSATNVMANDFSMTGTCKYYLTQDKWLATDSALAFQVI